MAGVFEMKDNGGGGGWYFMMAGTFSTRDRVLPNMKLFVSPFIWCV